MPLRAQKSVSQPVSKLSTVLKGLGVTRIEHDFGGVVAASSEETPDAPPLRPVIRLHQPRDEGAIQFSDTKQLQQLGQHLIRWRTELEKQQTQLRSEQHHWTRQMQLEHELIADRNDRLDQRQRQTKSIEFQVMQLQNDVIDAQVALEQTVTALTECSHLENQKHDRDGRTIAELTALRFEITERFDYLEKRWKNLRAEIFPAP
jgi:hypothetical protein